MRIQPPSLRNATRPIAEVGKTPSTGIDVEPASRSSERLPAPSRLPIRYGLAPFGLTSAFASVTFHDQMDPRGSETDAAGPPFSERIRSAITLR